MEISYEECVGKSMSWYFNRDEIFYNAELRFNQVDFWKKKIKVRKHVGFCAFKFYIFIIFVLKSPYFTSCRSIVLYCTVWTIFSFVIISSLQHISLIFIKWFIFRNLCWSFSTDWRISSTKNLNWRTVAKENLRRRPQIRTWKNRWQVVWRTYSYLQL